MTGFRTRHAIRRSFVGGGPPAREQARKHVRLDHIFLGGKVYLVLEPGGLPFSYGGRILRTRPEDAAAPSVS